MSGRAVLRLSPDDNVATALRDLEPGEIVVVDGLRLVVRDAVRLCHKLALCDLAPGAAVVKHGQSIGRATARIDAGAHVHVHNMRSARAQPA